MKKEQFFIGNVNICTKFEEENTYINERAGYKCGLTTHIIETTLYKENVPILKLKDDNYVCVDSIDSLKSYLELYDFILSKGVSKSDLILSTCPSNKDEIFVDVKSLIPYYDRENLKENTTIRKVKKDLMMDPRFPRGIDLEENKCYPIVKVKRYSTK